MKAAWLTDIHLDFLENDETGTSRLREEFLEPISALDVDAYLITGDISIGEKVVSHVRSIVSAVQRPVYFVCGNHDFYGASTGEVRRRLGDLTDAGLFYMSTRGHLSLTKTTAVVGHDGWYDGYNGDPFSSRFYMNDWVRIQDFVEARFKQPNLDGGLIPILGKARELSHVGSEHVLKHGRRAAEKHKNIVVLTHVPPWADVCMYKGRVSDDTATPWYSSKFMGQTLTTLAEEYPDVRFDVLCGHTHGRFTSQRSRNLFCHVGGSEYNHPGVSEILSLP